MDPSNATATAGIFATYPAGYLSVGEGLADQVTLYCTSSKYLFIFAKRVLVTGICIEIRQIFACVSFN